MEKYEKKINGQLSILCKRNSEMAYTRQLDAASPKRLGLRVNCANRWQAE
jgi:hypothetical protein